MDIEKLEKLLEVRNEPKFRFEQIKRAIFQEGVFSFSEISTISKDLGESLEKEIKILSFAPEKILKAKDSQSIKALLKLDDGNLIETVLISPKLGLWSACISSQVGCAMGCRFCATGKTGLKRNLIAEEITDQVLFWIQYLKVNKLKAKSYKLDNIVYMGMGEPFLNWEEVRKSLKDLINPELLGFGSRSISVSTSGIADKIANFGKEFPQINLAISLHFTSDRMRSKYMPVNEKYNLAELKNALQEYFKNSSRKVFIEYIMLQSINDSREDALDLANYLKSIGKAQLLHVNLIRYNMTSENLNPSSESATRKFKNYLLQNNINATIRKSLGSEIQGACGQLSGK